MHSEIRDATFGRVPSRSLDSAARGPARYLQFVRSSPGSFHADRLRRSDSPLEEPTPGAQAQFSVREAPEGIGQEAEAGGEEAAPPGAIAEGPGGACGPGSAFSRPAAGGLSEQGPGLRCSLQRRIHGRGIFEPIPASRAGSLSPLQSRAPCPTTCCRPSARPPPGPSGRSSTGFGTASSGPTARWSAGKRPRAPGFGRPLVGRGPSRQEKRCPGPP